MGVLLHQQNFDNQITTYTPFKTQTHLHNYMQTGFLPTLTTRIETQLTLKEDVAISEAAALAGVTRDQLAGIALKSLLKGIRDAETKTHQEGQ